ncbi:LOW QUALITY PROTEIN: meprin A subunit beta [Liasis olivaceus]
MYLLLGKEQYFKKYDNKVADSLNVPYDYTSIMHYRKTAFRKYIEPTVITNIPTFMNVVGPEMDFKTGYFMHFDTSAGRMRDESILESQLFYLKRGLQCLQFYYYNSGSESDQLNILVKEYIDANPKGILRLVKNSQSIKKCVFEGIKGPSISKGGLSIDDISLSETWYPHHVWHIRHFTDLLISAPANTLYCPPFYSPKGYAFQIALYVKGTTDLSSMAIYFCLIRSTNDYHLQRPCPWQQVTMVLLDQHRDIHQYTSNQKSLRTDSQMLGSAPFFVLTRSEFRYATEGSSVALSPLPYCE